VFGTTRVGATRFEVAKLRVPRLRRGGYKEGTARLRGTSKIEGVEFEATRFEVATIVGRETFEFGATKFGNANSGVSKPKATDFETAKFGATKPGVIRLGGGVL
jgi:hypothetical protein